MKSRSLLYSRYFTYIKPIGKIPVIKNYGPAIFTLLTISLLIFFAIKPTVETILVLQKRLVDSDQVLQKVTQKANNLSLGKKNYDNLDQNIKERIAAAIPDAISLKSLIQVLEQTAKAHEASVSALQVQPLVINTETADNQMGSLSEVSFTFNTEGNYENLISLLQDLKDSSRLISVDSLSISKVEEGTALIMSLSGKAFYLK
ncbi:type 4a pilus biogenesis protein PilO [Candidatus Daviesbacteria bacterium]|nr:type 4a pilus biogenesis protein PilO [Candidatus Daviesbacteria bacterium]